jgi:ATP-binding cassette subfamily F protein 3
MALFSASRLSLLYGDLKILTDVSAEIPERARIGVVGANGCGKSTLVRLIIGELEADAGTVYRSKGIRPGYIPQTPPPSPPGSLRDEILTAFEELHKVEEELQAVTEQMAAAGGSGNLEGRYNQLLHRYEALEGYNYLNTMERVASGVGLSSASLDAPAASASGGERTRAALAKALLSNPDLLVLDEPTNHLDMDGLDWLERFLLKFPGAFLVVSHDRYFLDRVAQQIWEIELGRLTVYPGNYSAYRVQKAERVLRQQKEHERQQEYIAKLKDFIARYHAGQRSREAKSRANRLQRLKAVDVPRKEETISMVKVSSSRTGQVVLRTRNLAVGYAGDREVVELLSTPDLKVEAGDRIGIIGANGTGKTTLVKTLLGQVPPLQGSMLLGHNVKMGYFQQRLSDLPDRGTVLDAFLEVKNIPISEARSFLARFLFRGEDVFQEVSHLSGGEKSRLALARLLINEINFLILDEPSTHLDIPSREALERVLMEFDGTLLFISHDRLLISLLAKQIWLVDNGRLDVFEGSFEEWMAVRDEEKEASEDAVERTERARPRRDPATAKRNPPRPPQQPKEDLAQTIAGLEDRLHKIERQLEKASLKQDLNAIARLGVEHNQVQEELDRKWEEWASQPTSKE